MLRFLSKLRLKFFTPSRQKYFLYALGEIALIVIGVLIALSINNWNERQKDDKKEIAILRGIRDNLQLDTIDINVNIRLYERVLQSDSLLLHTLVTQQPYDSSYSVLIMGVYFSSVHLVLHESAFQEARDEGLDIIGNKELRSNIRRLYEFDYPYLLDAENSNEHLSTAYLEKYFYDDPLFGYTIVGDDEMQVVVSREVYQRLLSDQEFHLMLAIHKSYNEGILDGRYKSTLDTILELIDQIEQELERLQ